MRAARLKIQAGYRELVAAIVAIESRHWPCAQHPGAIREFQFRE
jgi:hypothetical protein